MVTTRSSRIEESHRGRRAAWRQASVASIVQAAKVAALVPKKLKDQQMAKVKSHHIMVQWTSWLDTLRMDDSHGLEIPEEGDIPQPDVLVAFASHYSEYARGIQSKKIRTKTLLNNMRSLVRMLETAWNISIPQETKRILNTACVGPLSEIHQLHSDPSERPIADLETLESIISVIWSEEFQPKYQRERIQYHALLLLFLFTAARVGTILESSTYCGSDEGLSYRDINLRVYPSSDDENDITLSGQLVLRYAKGNRTSEGRNFRYNIADTDHISKNLCRLLLLIGFLDNAWQDFESLNDLIRLRYRIPSKGMVLRVKQPLQYQAVFVLESDGRLKRENGVARLPAVKAWHRFRELGQLAGLKDSFTIGSIRRLCANAINNPYFTDAQRRAAMAHADKSSVYASHYAAPQFNFQKVILNERGIDLPFATTSQTMDKKAPVRVSMATISNQLRQNKNFAADVHRQSLLKRAIIEQKGSIVSCQNLPVGKMYAKLHQRVQYHIGKARRETLHRARQAFFNSRVVLRIPRQVVKLAVHPSPILPIVQKPLPGHALLGTIRELVLGNDSKQGPADLKLLLSFSRLRTPLDSFYPDEEIVDNRCPQCALDMNTIRKVHRQSHVHRCRTNHKRKEATVSEKLVPSTRSLKESLSATRRIARKRVCTLEACGRHKRARTANFSSVDATARHIEEVHYIATSPKPRYPVYCYICLEWIRFWSWELDHTRQHFDDMFSIAVRMPYVSKVPEPAQSVDGQEFIEKPLLVGTLEAAHAFALDFHLVVRKPGFCPFCVYDMSLPWHRRMKQFSLPTIFRDHLVTHILSLSDDETYKCPDPCCSPSQYGPQELGSHLVLAHLLPVYGNVQAPHKLVNWGAPALRTSFWVREGFKNAKKASKVKKKAQNTADSECSDTVAESEEELETEDEMSSVVTDE